MLKKILNVSVVYATVGSEDKKKFLENNLQVSKAFNYKSPDEEDFSKQILELTHKKGVDVIFDCVGASYWEKNTDALGIDGYKKSIS
jgi:NADPH:quinone reductase-like Zn-dependent oxidoreductase